MSDTSSLTSVEEIESRLLRKYPYTLQLSRITGSYQRKARWIWSTFTRGCTRWTHAEDALNENENENKAEDLDAADDECNDNTATAPQQPTYKLIDYPLKIRDDRGNFLLAYMPGFYTKDEQETMTTAAHTLRNTGVLQSAKGNDARSNSKTKTGLLAHFSLWNELGKPYRGTMISSDALPKTAYKAGIVGNFLRAIWPIVFKAGLVVAGIDLAQYELRCNAVEKASRALGGHGLDLLGRRPFSGLAVVSNVIVKPHKDTKNCWLCVCAPCGSYNDNRTLVLPELGMSLAYKPGNLVIADFHKLTHYVDGPATTIGEDRICYVHYFHAAVWATHGENECLELAVRAKQEELSQRVDVGNQKFKRRK